MKNKFWFLVKDSLSKKVKTKTFIIVNVLLLLAIVSLTNIDKIVMFFGGNFDKENNIMVVDNTTNTYDVFKSVIDNQETIIDTGLKYKVSKEKNEKDARKKIKKDEDILIVINENEENIIDVKLVTYGYINSNLYQLIISSINSSKQVIAIEKLGIDPKDIEKISSVVDLKREYIEKNKNEEEENLEYIMGVLTPIIILPFFMLVTLLVQMIGAEINEEKSTRSMEIIISNVSAKTHFFSKVIASNLFVLTQSLLLFAYGALGILLRGGSSLNTNTLGEMSNITSSISASGILDNIYSYVPVVLILMAVTLIGYSLLAGVLASMTTNMEDFQQLQTPIMVISLAGFYLAIMSSMFEGSLFIRVLSYVPFISAILSPSLLLTGVITIKDILLSTLLMLVVIYLLIKYGLKIYKEGILNYSSTKLWKKMARALKK